MRYFIIPFDTPNLDKIKAVIYGDFDNQRKSLDGTMFVCFLHEGDTSDYDFLSQYEEYNEETILKALDNDLWRIKI